MRSIRERIKNLFFALIGKEPEAVVVTFASGPEALAKAMYDEVRDLEPDRRHYYISQTSGSWFEDYVKLRRQFSGLRIGLAPTLFAGEPHPLRIVALLLAPRKILAYNSRLERHHLRFAHWIASLLFLRGVPLDRIYLRPWGDNGTRVSEKYVVVEGRRVSDGRPKVAVVSPYFPYPLSHGGAVRIYNLMREASRHFDLYLFAFAEPEQFAQTAPVMQFTARAVLMELPRYREPRWASIEPPEVREFRSPTLAALIAKTREECGIGLTQVEFTFLADYGGDILVEHDVTYDLHQQIWRRERTLSALWNYWRWKRYEKRALRRFPRAVVMSGKDRDKLGEIGAADHAVVVPNGVDLDRFQAQPEEPGHNVLFVGSFRHSPNVTAWTYFLDEIWPDVSRRVPGIEVIVVAGPDYERFWNRPGLDSRIAIFGFVEDVRPLYHRANVVIVPTTVSAGTNLKVIEAMAMERAVISTPSGCQGLGVLDTVEALIAKDADAFGNGLVELLEHAELRDRLKAAAKALVGRQFSWRTLAAIQRVLWRESMPDAGELIVRPADEHDWTDIDRIQTASGQAAQWPVSAYASYDLRVAMRGGKVIGFIAVRENVPDEREVLNIAVDPEHRRGGVARAMMADSLDGFRGDVFLEVRVSNHGAKALYQRLGFAENGARRNYYDNPVEDAIVMRRRYGAQ